MSDITVNLPGFEHTITVAPGVLAHLGQCLPDYPTKTKFVVVTSPYLNATYGDQVRAGLAGFQVHTIEVADGEANKTRDGLGAIWDGLADLACGRGDVLIALGGGVIGDMAGFAAATYVRGMAVVHVPTTVLAMVDSSIGGKTGINLAAGKNLVGAFHQPAAVVIDPMVLATLDPRQRRAGLGEAAKYGYIVPTPLAELLHTHAQALAADTADVPMDVMAEVVRLAAQIKVDHIVQDPYEHGIRAHLNYGHTIGHAIEQICGYGTWLHGEAVGLGMIVAARLGALLGHCDASIETHTRATLTALRLPTSLGTHFDAVANPDTLWAVLSRDKKNRPGESRFVLPIGLGKVNVVTNPDPNLVLTALNALA